MQQLGCSLEFVYAAPWDEACAELILRSFCTFAAVHSHYKVHLQALQQANVRARSSSLFGCILHDAVYNVLVARMTTIKHSVRILPLQAF